MTTWQHKQTVSELDPRALWRVWADVNQWHTWDTDIEYARLQAPFAQGSRFELKPKGGPKVRIELERVEPGVGFTDVTRFPLAKMSSDHGLRVVDGGVEVTHTIKVEGLLAPLWRKLVVAKVAAGLAEQARGMIARARELQAQ